MEVGIVWVPHAKNNEQEEEKGGIKQHKET